MWTLFNAIFLFASILLAQAIASPGQSDSAAILPSLYLLAVFTPGLCVTVRRLHDVNRSGWWLLIGFVPLFGVIVLLAFEVTEGTPGPNRFGPDPQRSVSPD